MILSSLTLFTYFGQVICGLTSPFILKISNEVKLINKELMSNEKDFETRLWFNQTYVQ